MVLLAAAVCTKSGKALVSRQFVEMTKSRIEGLLAAFPKLMTGGRQHTFVETESVRYVYQPLDRLYMLLITTRASNILEDLETLRLFSRVIPEYCRTMEESEILDNSFHLIFAFDEIVALGYRESVNLAQIRTFVEMDSHEEKVYRAVRETQEREARTKMKEKVKDIQRKRYEEIKRGSKNQGYSSGNSGGFGLTGGFGGGPGVFTAPTENITTSTQETRPSTIKPAGSNRAMKLGSKAKDVDSFVDQLKSEGERVVSSSESVSKMTPSTTPQIDMEPIHIVMSEDIVVHAGRDGGLQNMEVQGILKLRITESEHGFIKVQVDNTDTRPVQVQTHPNVDRDLWRSCGQIGMKMSNKPFPHNTDVGVLKWRFQTSDDSHVPLSINCWPQENGAGGCDVNIEYNLEKKEMELNEVTITIPLASGAPPPIVNECEGEHEYDRAHCALVWRIPVIDKAAPTAAMDFTARGVPDNFFPVRVSFNSKRPFCDLKVLGVVSTSDGAPVTFSHETQLKTNVYEID
ncbi:coatomer subunit delta-like [Homarus americanus]|uniref:Coatomer subunit delta n=1 Tax=Homarus americanus TaxID=6706 RepID=A0A8J5N4L5_HOMAM|nr:coatomer subunit delta-like [Homarus americanus]KAG7173256.1 Coatomer subunit delta-like [Homarus americanus]